MSFWSTMGNLFSQSSVIAQASTAPSQPRSVELPSPWRDVPYLWEEQACTMLRMHVENSRPPNGLAVNKYRLLTLGFAQAGKSSFFNSLTSACQDEVSFQAEAIASTAHVTKQFRVYSIRNRLSDPLNFQFLDTMGITLDTGLSTQDIRALMGGHVPVGYKFTDTPISPTTPGYIPAPTLGERPHVLVLVIDIMKVDTLAEVHWAKLKDITKMASPGDLHLPVIVVLTKIDEICRITKNDTEKVYKSQEILKRVETVSKRMGINIGQILPIQNYVRETYTSQKMNILLMETLRHILNQAKALLHDKLDEQDNSSVQPLRNANNLMNPE